MVSGRTEKEREKKGIGLVFLVFRQSEEKTQNRVRTTEALRELQQ
jgi:hypothetical protein